MPTIGEEAASELYEMRALNIGKVAPNIAGLDMNGAPLQLNNYRGKVVVSPFDPPGVGHA